MFSSLNCLKKCLSRDEDKKEFEMDRLRFE